jgi:mono/diheme cytochrome c family protein
MKLKEKDNMRMILMTVTLAVLCCSVASAADAAAGRAAYDKSCKSCHGADGTPNAGVAKMMKVEIKDLKSAGVQRLSDTEMKSIITDGKGKMKPIPGVTGASLDNVVAYVKSLK